MAKKTRKTKEQQDEDKKYLRRVTYELYPTKKQSKLLFLYKKQHKVLYNTMLEQRKTVYQSSGKSLSFADQCKHITQLRSEDPDYKNINAQSLQVTADRLDKAYQNFFRRVNSGEVPSKTGTNQTKSGKAPGFSPSKTDSNQPKAGFPRFKSNDRFKGFGYKTYNDGWRLNNHKPKGKKKMRNGNLDLSGIGKIKKRGASKYEGLPICCDLLFKAGTWKLSVVIDIRYKLDPERKKRGAKLPVEDNPKREAGKEAGGFDWGTETFLTVAKEDETYYSVENPRNGKKSKEKLATAQQELSRKKKGSKNREKEKRIVQKIYAKIKNQRDDFLHQESNKLIKRFGILATEELDIKSLVEKNANEGKHGLNREILDTAPSRFLSFCSYKAEEAGSIYSEIDTKKWMPSQTCSGCSFLVPKELGDREHNCPHCGLLLKRDENSSSLCLNVILYGKATSGKIRKKSSAKVRSREPTDCGGPTGPMKQESLSILECTNSLDEFV